LTADLEARALRREAEIDAQTSTQEVKESLDGRDQIDTMRQGFTSTDGTRRGSY
jgi:cytidylate kinase